MIKLSKGANEQTNENVNADKIPEYKVIEKVAISKNLLASLVKFSENPVNHQVEGILFGHEEEHEIIVETALPLAQVSSNVNEDSLNMRNYLENSRLDFIQVGFFFCKAFTEFFKKKNLKQFLNFQQKFPNAVFIFVDYELLKTENYGIQCLRINKSLMEIVDKLGIEEEKQDISSKFIPEEKFFKNLSFTLIEDVYSVFSSASSDENIKHANSFNEERKESFFSYGLKNNLFVRINELNKMSEKFIQEQKKYINYYKIKKQYGKTKESEFFELLNKKGNELANLDKLDMPIYSKNILNMNERIKTITDKMNVKNSFSVNI